MISNLGSFASGCYILQPPVVVGMSSVKWNSPPLIENTPVIKYELQQSTNGSDFETIYKGQQTEHKTSQLKLNTTYFYRYVDTRSFSF